MELKKDVRVILSDDVDTGKSGIMHFCDALYYPIDEVPKDTEIEKQAQERIDNWMEIIKNPPPAVEPTTEELEKMIADLEAQKLDLQTQLDNKRK